MGQPVPGLLPIEQITALFIGRLGDPKDFLGAPTCSQPDDVRPILAPVYDRFTEGFETAHARCACDAGIGAASTHWSVIEERELNSILPVRTVAGVPTKHWISER